VGVEAGLLVEVVLPVGADAVGPAVAWIRGGWGVVGVRALAERQLPDPFLTQVVEFGNEVANDAPRAM